MVVSYKDKKVYNKGFNENRKVEVWFSVINPKITVVYNNKLKGKKNDILSHTKPSMICQMVIKNGLVLRLFWVLNEWKQ